MPANTSGDLVIHDENVVCDLLGLLSSHGGNGGGDAALRSLRRPSRHTLVQRSVFWKAGSRSPRVLWESRLHRIGELGSGRGFAS